MSRVRLRPVEERSTLCNSLPTRHIWTGGRDAAVRNEDKEYNTSTGRRSPSGPATIENGAAMTRRGLRGYELVKHRSPRGLAALRHDTACEAKNDTTRLRGRLLKDYAACGATNGTHGLQGRLLMNDKN